MAKQPMTVNGKKNLEKELKHLKSVERPSIISAIEEAIGHGDLSENADYSAAKERQAFAEARVAEIEGKIAESEVIDPSTIKSNNIVFGATVTLLDCNTDEEVTYQIVGEEESDVKNGRVSVFSPLARAIIGKKKGDLVEFTSPKNEKEYEIITFEFK